MPKTVQGVCSLLPEIFWGDYFRVGPIFPRQVQLNKFLFLFQTPKNLVYTPGAGWLSVASIYHTAKRRVPMNPLSMRLTIGGSCMHVCIPSFGCRLFKSGFPLADDYNIPCVYVEYIVVKQVSRGVSVETMKPLWISY